MMEPNNNTDPLPPQPRDASDPTTQTNTTTTHQFHLPDPYAVLPQGDSHTTKQPHHTRIYFQNTNGLKWANNQLDITNKCHHLQSIQIDMFGLAETNLNLSDHTIFRKFRTLLNNPFNKQISFSTSTSKTKFTSAWKPGGTITATTSQWISRVIEKGEEPNGTGTWSYIKIRGSHNKTIVIVTLYRLCHKTENANHGPETIYSQIYSALQPSNAIKPQLRKRCDDILRTHLDAWIAQNFEIILMTDANEPRTTPAKGFHKIMQELDMHDPYTHLHPTKPQNFPTYFRGSNRIDFAYVTPNILQHIRRCGYLTYHDGLDCGDHRGLFLDLDEIGFLGEQSPILPPAARILNTNFAKRATTYRRLLCNYIKEKKIQERINTLLQHISFHMTSTYHQTRYDAIDNDLTRAMIAAENRCGKIFPSNLWSPELRDAALTVRYWNVRILEIRSNRSYATFKSKIQEITAIEDSGQPTLQYTYTKLKTAKAALKQARKDEAPLRDAHLTDLAAFYVATNRSPTQLQAIKRITNAEAHKSTYQKVKHCLNPTEHSGLSRLEVPSSSVISDTNLAPNPQLTHYPSSSNDWIPITTKEHIEAHLLQRNATHFRQANDTPFGANPRGQDLGYLGTSASAKSILEGTYNFEMDNLTPEARAYIKELQYHPTVATGGWVDTNLTTDDIKQTFGAWRESTSTSPSGRHLSHYKTIIMDDNTNTDNTLLQTITDMMNIPIKSNIVPSRWNNSVSVCLEKKPGQPQTNKIRIIHILEADYNGMMKAIWARRLVAHTEKIEAYPDAQYGSRPGRSAIDAATVKILSLETSKISFNVILLADNDASACYDRIISPISSIACQSTGMPAAAEQIHTSVLLNTKYRLKTSYGITANHYAGDATNPLQGQGQGSGNSPACWNAVSSPMWKALEKLSPLRFTTTTPDQETTTSTQGVAFVDDAMNMFNIPLTEPLPDNQQLIERFNELVQHWEKLLHTNGGALNPDKCFWFAMLWDRSGTTPRLMHASEHNHQVHLTNSTNGVTTTLAHKDVDTAERTLGIRISPTGNMAVELQWLTEKAAKFQKLLTNCRLLHKEATVAYTSYWLPRITYSFPVTTLSEQQCNKLQQKTTTSFLLTFGFNRHFPRIVTYGPTSHGGLNFKHLYTEQGVLRIQHFMGHLRKNTTIGKMHLANILTHQLISGLSQPLLEETHRTTPYLQKSLFTETRRFLDEIQCTILIPAAATPLAPRLNDAHIMDHLNSPNYTKHKLQHINACRMYLQAITLSDLCNGAGTHILPEVMIGRPIPTSNSKWAWPRQHRPPSQSWIHWRSALRKHFTRNNHLALRPECQLGAWTIHHATHHRQWHHHSNPRTGTTWQIHSNGTITKYQPRHYNMKRRNIHLTGSPTSPTEFSTNKMETNPASIASRGPIYQTISVYQTPPRHDNPPPNATAQDDIQAWLSTQQPWAKSLLGTNMPSSSNSELQLFQAMLTSTTIDLFVSTNAHRPHFHYGWGLYRDGSILWSGQGEIAAPQNSDTPRTQIHGILAAVTLIQALQEIHHHVAPRPPIHIQIHNITNRTFETVTFPLTNPTTGALRYNTSTYDITAQLQHITNASNIHFIRPPTTTPDDNPQHQINVTNAKILANNSLTKTEQRHQTTPQYTFPKCLATLQSTNHHLTNHIATDVRTARDLPPLRYYIEQRNHWHPNTWETIDWTIHSRSINKIPRRQHHQVAKYIHNWLPTFGRLHKLNQHPTDICPRCKDSKETNQHLIQCRWISDETFKIQKTSKLATILKKSNPTSNDAIHQAITQCIEAWMHNQPQPDYDHLLHDPNPYLHAAIATQEVIGWDNFLKSRFSKAWSDCLAHNKTTNATNASIDATLLQIANWSWDLFFETWKERNKLVFGANNENTSAIQLLRQEAEITETYEACNQLPQAARRHHQYLPLQDLLKARTSTLTLWLTQARQTIAEHRKHINKGREQTLLTRFFPLMA
jgi:hypothetical protein